MIDDDQFPSEYSHYFFLLIDSHSEVFVIDPFHSLGHCTEYNYNNLIDNKYVHE